MYVYTCVFMHACNHVHLLPVLLHRTSKAALAAPLCVHMYAYMHTCMHTKLHKWYHALSLPPSATHTHALAHTHTHTHTHTNHIHMHTHTHAHTHTHTHHIHMCTHTHALAYTHTHTYTHTQIGEVQFPSTPTSGKNKQSGQDSTNMTVAVHRVGNPSSAVCVPPMVQAFECPSGLQAEYLAGMYVCMYVCV
jgi:hypothetical protein